MEEPIEAMKTIKGYLDKINVPFLLCGSTLLGIYRDNIPLGRLEIDILAEDFTHVKALELYKIHPYGYREPSIKELSIVDIDLNPRVEIQFIYFTDKYGYKNIRSDECLVWPKVMYEKQNWGKKVWKDTEWNIPGDVEGYLTYYYGDWKTPTKEWNWGRATNYKKLVNGALP